MNGVNLFNYEDVGQLSSIEFNETIQDMHVLRFMDWMKTNNEVDFAEGWAKPKGKQKSSVWDYPKSNQDWQYTGGAWDTFDGVPLDIIAETANRNGSRAWLNIPHKANKELTAYIVDTIVKLCDKRPIIEFSNELWNSTFYQFYFARDNSYGRNDLDKVINFHAIRTIELYEMVAGRADVALSGWSKNAWYASNLLERVTIEGKLHCDILAIAPYFSVSSNGIYTVDDLDKALRKSIDSEILPCIKAHKLLADLYNVPLWTYETGQHLEARDENEKRIYLDWNRSNDALCTYNHFRDVLISNGVDLVMWYANASTYTNQYWGNFEIVNGKLNRLPKSYI